MLRSDDRSHLSMAVSISTMTKSRPCVSSRYFDQVSWPSLIMWTNTPAELYAISMPSLIWKRSCRNTVINSALHKRVRKYFTSATLPSKPIMFLRISGFLNCMHSMKAFMPSHLSKNVSQFSGVSSLINTQLE